MLSEKNSSKLLRNKSKKTQVVGFFCLWYLYIKECNKSKMIITMEDEKINEAEIKDGEVSEVESENEDDVTSAPEELTEEQKAKKKKRDFYIEAVLFLVLGILMGVAIKTEAAKKITIGFDDYRMAFYHQDFNLNQMQADLNKKAEEAQKQAQENPAQNAPGQNSAQPGQGQDQGGQIQVQPGRDNSGQ
jgi:hypothetical protein